MIYELEIEDGKENPVINFLKQLDFLTIKSIKKTSRKKVVQKTPETVDLPYFGVCTEWEFDVKELRKNDSSRRLEGWL